MQQLRQGCSTAELQQQLTAELETSNLQWWPLDQGWPLALQQRIEQHRQRLEQQANTPALSDAEALACLEDLLVLSPRRSGRQGVSQLNRRWLPLTQKEPWHWPAGTPLLVGRNDASLGLANGDRGLVRPGPQGRSRDRHRRRAPAIATGAVALPRTGSGPHRAQKPRQPGSRGDRGDAGWQQLDRRLLYTALTRAKEQVDLLSPPLESLEA